MRDFRAASNGSLCAHHVWRPRRGVLRKFVRLGQSALPEIRASRSRLQREGRGTQGLERTERARGTARRGGEGGGESAGAGEGLGRMQIGISPWILPSKGDDRDRFSVRRSSCMRFRIDEDASTDPDMIRPGVGRTGTMWED